jgi:hypothetical protein
MYVPVQASITAYRDGDVLAITGLDAEPFGWADDFNNAADRLLDNQLSLLEDG